MDETPRILRLEIDGQWTADEMAKSFRSLNNLYNLRLAIQIVEDRARDLDRYYRRHNYPPIDFLFDPVLRLQLFPPYARLLDAGPRELRDIISAVDSDDELRIRRVRYGSKGHKDLLGIGAIIEQLRKLVGDIVRMPQEYQARREQIKKMQIENARDFVRLRVESAEADRQIRNLAKLAATESLPLIDLADQGKLLGAELISEENDEA
jgi:hypothetical protein